MSILFDENSFNIRIMKTGIIKEFEDDHTTLISQDELLKLKTAVDKTMEYYSERCINENFIKTQNKRINTINRKKDLNERRIRAINCVDEGLPPSQLQSSLYMVYNRSSNKIKIGQSKKPKQRLTNLQVCNHDRLELLFVIKNKGYLEKQLHEAFREFKFLNEWFDYDERIIDYFKELNCNS